MVEKLTGLYVDKEENTKCSRGSFLAVNHCILSVIPFKGCPIN
jgi:hypothetical protein